MRGRVYACVCMCVETYSPGWRGSTFTKRENRIKIRCFAYGLKHSYIVRGRDARKKAFPHQM